MANEFVVKKGLIVQGNTQNKISGSLIVSGSVYAFLFTGSFSGSFIGTASVAESSSYSLTASYALNGGGGGGGGLGTGSTYPITSSYAITASYAVGSTPSFSGKTDNYAPKWSSNTLTATSNIYDAGGGSGVNIGNGTPINVVKSNVCLYISSSGVNPIVASINGDLLPAQYNATNFSFGGIMVGDPSSTDRSTHIVIGGTRRLQTTNIGIMGFASLGDPTNILTASVGAAILARADNTEATASGMSMLFCTKPSSDTKVSINLRERMRITERGLVGLGTSAPAANLHISSSLSSSVILSSGGKSWLWLNADIDNTNEGDNAYIRLNQDGELVESTIGYVGADNADVYGNTNGISSSRNNALVITNTSPGYGDIQFAPQNTASVIIYGTQGSTFGNVGIGTNIPVAKLHAFKDFSALTGDYRGVYVFSRRTYEGVGVATAAHIGCDVQVFGVASGSNSGSANPTFGTTAIRGYSLWSGSGNTTCSSSTCFYAEGYAYASASITNLYGLRVILASYYEGSVDNAYGVFVSTMNNVSPQGNMTNTWGIYQAGSADRNHFRGNTGIGSTYTQWPLSVQTTGGQIGMSIGNTTNSGSIRIAAGTNLWPGYIAWYSGSGTRFSYLGYDSSEYLNWNLSVPLYIGGDKVGIGITNPSVPLHIADGSSQEMLRLYMDAGTNVYMSYQNTAAIMYTGISNLGHYAIGASPSLQTNPYVTIRSGSGLVGIGTTNPNAQLEIYDANSTTIVGNLITQKIYQASTANGTQDVYGSYVESVGIGGSSGITYGGTIYGSYVASSIGFANIATGSNVVGQFVTSIIGAQTRVTGSVCALSLNIDNQQIGASSTYFTNVATVLTIQPITGSNVTTKYAIFQAGTLDNNFFAGNTGFETTPNSINSINATSINALRITASVKMHGTASQAISASYAPGGAPTFTGKTDNTVPYWISNTLSDTSPISIGTDRVFLNGTSSTGEVLFVRGTSSVSPNFIAEFTHDTNTYAQVKIENTNAGNTASADLIVESDKASENFGFIDLGINSSGYAVSEFNLTQPLDGYLYTEGSASVGGNLCIGNMDGNKAIKFHTSGSKAENERLRIEDTSIQNSKPIYPRYASAAVLEDDFFNGGTETGETGIGWSVAGGSMVGTNGSRNHPGVVRRRSAAGGTSVSEMSLFTSATMQEFGIDTVESMCWIINPDTPNITASLLRFGLLTSTTSSTVQANGLFFEYSGSARPYWRMVYASASSQAFVDAPVAVTASNWYNLEARFTTGSTISFFFSRSLAGVIAFSQSHQSVVNYGNSITVPTGSGISTAVREVIIDYTRLALHNLNR